MRVLATVLAGAVWTAGAFEDVVTFGVMIEDFDNWKEENDLRRNDNGGGEFRGAAWLDVTYGLTVGALINKVNHKEVDYEAYKVKVEGLIVGALRDRVPEFEDYWNRDDGGRMYSEMQQSLQTSDADLFVSAFYGGKMLDERATLRSVGVGPSSTLFLRRMKNHGQNFKETSTDREVMVSTSGFNPETQQCTQANQCRKTTISYWTCEPMMNVAHLLANEIGISTDALRMKIKPRGSSQMSMKVDNLLFVNQQLPHEAEFLYKRMYGMHMAKSNVHYSGFLTYDWDRYNRDLTLVPFADLNTQFLKVTDPKYECECIERPDERVGHALTRKLRMQRFGYTCGAWDADMKYCGFDKLDKGDRRCWCPLKWCYTNSHCGLPSKQFPGLFYSYTFCGNPVDKLKCYSADEEGAPEAKIEVMDVWEWNDLHRFLKNLVSRVFSIEDLLDNRG